MTSPIGVHALVFTGDFDTAGIEQSAQRAAKAGFDLIEYPLMDPFTFDAAAARREARRYLLRFPAGASTDWARSVAEPR